MRVGVRDFSLYKRPRKCGRPVYYARFHNDDGSWTAGCSAGQTVRSLAEGWATAEVRRLQAEVQEGEQAPPADTDFAAFADRDFFSYEPRPARWRRSPSGWATAPRPPSARRSRGRSGWPPAHTAAAVCRWKQVPEERGRIDCKHTHALRIYHVSCSARTFDGELRFLETRQRAQSSGLAGATPAGEVATDSTVKFRSQIRFKTP